MKYPNMETMKAFLKTYEHLSSKENIMVSVSGGADSDIVIDLLLRASKKYKITKSKFHFVFFDTGIEYEATKKHLEYLEEKYEIKIDRMRALTPVPLGCKKYGLPFISKYISEMLERMQNHNFNFKEDGNKTYDELVRIYPNLKGALRWWTNNNGENSSFNINRNSLLKEFIIENPPAFKISNKCCNGAKKNSSQLYLKNNKVDCKCLGLRKSEGGIRALSIKSCWEEKANKGGYSVFRPIFWFTDKDKQEYKDYYKVVYSDCYSVYGMKRTGCCGCPYGSNWERELEIVQKFEPKLYQACINIFGEAYDYNKRYKEYKKIRNYNE